MKKSFKVGESVVLCSADPITKLRGASGVVISREVSHGRVRSVLVRWTIHRNGVSCFRIRGNARAKSDIIAELMERGIPDGIVGREHPRFEEKGEALQALDVCEKCPHRLKRLFKKCPMVMSPNPKRRPPHVKMDDKSWGYKF